MTKTDHLARAKDYIARGEDFYRKAAEEIQAAMNEDSTLGFGRVAEQIGKSDKWCRTLVQWSTNPEAASATPFARTEGENERKDAEASRRALRDPEQRRAVITNLAPAEVDAVIEDANDVAVERLRAKQAEHRMKPTVGDLVGGKEAAEELRREFEPENLWIDGRIMRIDKTTRSLERFIAEKGLRLGPHEADLRPDYSSAEEWALVLVEGAEKRLAEVRAALQERLRDHQMEEVS